MGPSTSLPRPLVKSRICRGVGRGYSPSSTRSKRMSALGESRHVQLWAKSGHKIVLLNHLVGAVEESAGNIEL